MNGVAKLPFFVAGEVTKGFGRGSKELGIPTANYSSELVKSLPPGIQTGVYVGWAKVDNGPVYKMVMSVGWNHFYNNKEKTMEIHIMHKFDNTFYGSQLKVCVVNYIRPMENYSSVDELIAAINSDIATAHKQLETPEFAHYKTHEYFS